MTIAVGPEGGFTDEEFTAAVAAGWQPVDLGARLLPRRNRGDCLGRDHRRNSAVDTIAIATIVTLHILSARDRQAADYGAISATAATVLAT